MSKWTVQNLGTKVCVQVLWSGVLVMTQNKEHQLWSSHVFCILSLVTMACF